MVILEIQMKMVLALNRIMIRHYSKVIECDEDSTGRTLYPMMCESSGTGSSQGHDLDSTLNGAAIH